MDFNIPGSEGPRLFCKNEYSEIKSYTTFLLQFSQHSCIWPVPPLTFQVRSARNNMGKKSPFLYLQCVGGNGILLQVRVFFPQSERQCKNIPPYVPLCLFCVFPLPVRWDHITYLDLCPLNKGSILGNICWKCFWRGTFIYCWYLRKKVIVNSWKGIFRICILVVSMGMRRKAIAEA